MALYRRTAPTGRVKRTAGLSARVNAALKGLRYATVRSEG